MTREQLLSKLAVMAALRNAQLSSEDDLEICRLGEAYRPMLQAVKRELYGVIDAACRAGVLIVCRSNTVRLDTVDDKGFFPVAWDVFEAFDNGSIWLDIGDPIQWEAPKPPLRVVPP